MSDKLKPCPFCGAHAEIKTLFDDFYIEIFEGRVLSTPTGNQNF